MFTLTFSTGNDAFKPYPNEEITRILKQVQNNIQVGIVNGKIKDENGNTIGKFEFVEED